MTVERSEGSLPPDLLDKETKDKVKIIPAIRELAGQLPPEVTLNSVRIGEFSPEEFHELTAILDKLPRKRLSTFGQLSQESSGKLLESRSFSRRGLQKLKEQIAKNVAFWQEYQNSKFFNDLANLTPFERTIVFLKIAIAEGAHLRKPKTITEESWVRTRNIIGSYSGSPITKKGLSEEYRHIPSITEQRLYDESDHVTLEAIRQIIKNGTKRIWKNCSTVTQASFPLAEIALTKPQHKERPLTQTMKNRQLAYELAKATDKNKIQELLKRVKYSFYQTYTQGENPLLIKFKDLIIGFHPAPKDRQLFIQVLQDSGITIYDITRKVRSDSNKGTQRYYFIAAQNQQEAREALLASPKLARFLENPVKQIAGPTQKVVPTTWQLAKKVDSDFISAGLMFAEFGFRFSGTTRLRSTDIFTENYPVPIYQWNNSYFFPKDKKAVLRELIARRLEELG